jgi:hypothetical protein
MAQYADQRGDSAPCRRVMCEQCLVATGLLIPEQADLYNARELPRCEGQSHVHVAIVPERNGHEPS